MADQEPTAKSRPTKKLKKEFDEIDENSVAKFRRGQPIATKNVRTPASKSITSRNQPHELITKSHASFNISPD